MTAGPYELARKAHLFRSPSVTLPPPVTLPTADLHPLPPDLQAYFVYPFSLETFVLDPNNPSSQTIDDLHKSHTSYLQWRQEEKHRKEQERLKRLAPGWTAGTLQPTKRKSMLGESVVTAPTSLLDGDDDNAEKGQASQTDAPAQQLDAMQELVEHLSRLDAAADQRQQRGEEHQDAKQK